MNTRGIGEDFHKTGGFDRLFSADDSTYCCARCKNYGTRYNHPADNEQWKNASFIAGTLAYLERIRGNLLYLIRQSLQTSGMVFALPAELVDLVVQYMRKDQILYLYPSGSLAPQVCPFPRTKLICARCLGMREEDRKEKE
jgi:hypothetical protein